MTIVDAAGGVVVRDDMVLVAHRPYYDDWTLPKGKLDVDDADLAACALREMWEETGYRCTLREPSVTVTYPIPGNRTKRVTYWRMTVDSGAFVANTEVDEVRWLSPAEARTLLTHGLDREVLDQLLR